MIKFVFVGFQMNLLKVMDVFIRMSPDVNTANTK
jgi:hypothetical protein